MVPVKLLCYSILCREQVVLQKAAGHSEEKMVVASSFTVAACSVSITPRNTVSDSLSEKLLGLSAAFCKCTIHNLGEHLTQITNELCFLRMLHSHDHLFWT